MVWKCATFNDIESPSLVEGHMMAQIVAWFL